jgi:hypothetical protein
MKRPGLQISMRTLFARTFTLIRHDYVVLLPSLIVAFLVTLNSGLLKGTLAAEDAAVNGRAVLVLITTALVNLLAQAVTIVLGNMLYNKEPSDIAVAFKKAFLRFPILVFLMFFSFLSASIIALPVSQLPKIAATILWVPLLFFFMVFFQLFPVIILLEDVPLLGYFRIAFTMFKETTPNLLRFFVVIAMVTTLTILIGLPLTALGEASIAKKIILPFLQGLSSAFVVLLSVIFYQENKTSIRADA